jgi:carotenoid cleavage dioxygenase-like enzyme
MAVTQQKQELPWHLKGNWAPVQDELTVANLPVAGEIPRELNGIYIRNGMNPRSGWSDHWFFGNGMVHGVELADGKASYRNRFVKTPYYEKEMDILSAISDPQASPANTHVVRHAGRILALEEAHIPWEIDRQLNTVGPVDFGGKLRRAFTAHPRICPETNEMLAFGYTMMEAPYLVYYRVAANGNLLQFEPIDIPRPVMMHDWNVTRHHVVFMDLPIVFAMEHGGFAFKPECGARLGVMPRDGSNAAVRWFEINPCYVFHSLNAHEDGDTIVLYVCRQPHAMKGGFYNVGTLSEDTSARLWRWTIDLARGQVKEEQIDDAPGDFPRIDDRRVGLQARYGYTLGLVPMTGSPTYDRWVYKYDLQTGKRQRHDLGKNVHGGEPQFVPRAPDAGEDDGWVLLIAHDEAINESALVILDARNIEAAPVAKVTLPRRVPYGAHGNWFADT